VPVGQIVDAGAAGVSLDVGLVRTTVYDATAAALDAGRELWLGVVPAVATVPPPTDRQLVEAVQRFADVIGVDPVELDGRLVLTPSCGLAGASPEWSRHALQLARATASALSGTSVEPTVGDGDPS
jgi:hypothetical protein